MFEDVSNPMRRVSVGFERISFRTVYPRCCEANLILVHLEEGRMAGVAGPNGSGLAGAFPSTLNSWY
jgi:hypothetical protein